MSFDARNSDDGRPQSAFQRLALALVGHRVQKAVIVLHCLQCQIEQGLTPIEAAVVVQRQEAQECWRQARLCERVL